MIVFPDEYKEYTGRRAVEADKPINLCGRNWNKTTTLTSSIDIVNFWFKWLAFRKNAKAPEGTMSNKVRL